ncbi:MAG: DUF1847 domain-containing protein, partial [Deltaproteobacteria bacterium]|nr:DUF1847 domain-containing protein [Deltaproteobacteria bacterium]
MTVKCAICEARPCREGTAKIKKLPSFCPITNYKSFIRETTKKYLNQDIKDFYLSAALTEKECYDERMAKEEGKIVPLRPRIREIAEFAKKIGAKTLGLAFCSGLYDEAQRANAILENHGLDIVSVICSCGSVDKHEVGIPPEYRIRDQNNFEAACNPLLQAELLNRAGTAFNILVGLCVGHDMLFTSFSKAPVTTLIVKDRLTGHNPVISLYSR